MTESENNLFYIIDLASRSSENVKEGSFVFSDINSVKKIQEEATKRKVSFDEYDEDLRFKIESDEVTIYDNYLDFYQKFPEKINSERIKKFHCVFENGILRILKITDNNVYSFCYHQDEINNNDDEYSLSNVFYWEQIVNRIKSFSEVKETSNYLLIQSLENGNISITLSSYDKNCDSIDLHSIYKNLSEVITRIDKDIMLLKNRIVQINEILLKDRYSLTDIIQQLNAICYKTERDYEIKSYKINYDSYIEKYNDEKNNFFLKIQEIVEKNLSTIFTLPLTYAGALFTLDKLNDLSEGKFIYVAICIYTVVSLFFLMYELIEFSRLKNEISHKIRFFTNDSELLKKDFKKDENSLYRRIKIVTFVVVGLMLTFVGLLIWITKIIFQINNG